MIKLWKLLAPKFDNHARHRVSLTNGLMEKFQNGRKIGEMEFTDVFEVHYAQYTDNQTIFEFFDIGGSEFVVSKSWEGSSQILQHLISLISNGTDEEIKLMSDAMLSKDCGPKLFWQRREL